MLRSGVIALKGGVHLSARQQFQRGKIVAAIEHKRATGMTAVEAITDYVRDAAFTTLNRFVALKMLEACQLVQACITEGERSAGYREFCGMAPGVALLPDAAGYRLYVESLFDEFSTEIKVLFDRRDAASVLWPKRPTFEALLAILNAPDLAAVWGEDETIGWVYQFFNSGEERKKMRNESHAPRNSRELAVRNQFFTPRYVVQFLVDNTLGRIWLEIHGEQTRIPELCEYLVRSADDPIQPRPRKDPRDLRILDPACGSGHFLLYSFDLLLEIYEEAWAAKGPAPRCEATGRSLREDYPDLAELRRAAPRLIVELNLHGVDVDPRCAQIAALALWLRAQRAWKDVGIAASDRPRIQRTHIVVAEPMPGHAALVDEFAAHLTPPLLRDLFKKMVGESRLAGELGILLRVENAIAAELRRAREQFVKQRKTTEFLPGMEPVAKQGSLDLSGIDDDSFFHEAEARIVETLQAFAETAIGSAGVRRRLFAGDATQGVALVDLVRTRFDVVLMNPPFGQTTARAYEYIRSAYAGSHADIYASFVRRGRELAPDGLVGAITSRSFLLTPRLETFRISDIVPALELVADLGLGVMDTARVESAAYVLGNGTADVFLALDCRRGRNVAPELLSSARFSTAAYRVDRATVRALPQSKLLYSLPHGIARLLQDSPAFEPSVGTAREGMKSFENERFVRLWWEVAPPEIGRNRTWQRFAKGGSHAFFYAPIFLVLNWRAAGKELQAVNERLNGSTAQVRQASEYWYRPGITYSKRSAKGFSARCLPSEVVFSSNGPAVLPTAGVSAITLLGWINSRPVRALLHLQSNFGDFSTGAIKRLPWVVLDANLVQRLETRTGELLRKLISLDQQSEVSPLFVSPLLLRLNEAGEDIIKQDLTAVKSLKDEVIAGWDAVVGLAYGNEDLKWAEELLLPTNAGDETDEGDEAEEHQIVDEGDGEEEFPILDAPARAADLVSWAVGVSFGRFDVRLATGARSPPAEPKPFDPLPASSPAMLTGSDRLPVAVSTAEYPVMFPENGILVEDLGHARDLAAAVREVFDVAFGANGDDWWDEAAALLDPKRHDLRAWLTTKFFAHHLKRYSVSKRKAPIVWQLGTPSGQYCAWLYAHRLTADSFFQLQNDVVTPKLAHEERQLADLIENAGPNPSAKEREEIAAQDTFVEELRAFIEEVKRVAPLWNPALDDGVMLTMAPLWRLVPQIKAWQKELKRKWDELAAGKYDWAHLAMHLWPERVVPKCANDRSLAVAHGLEDVFWVEGDDGKWKPRPSPTRPIDTLVLERTSVAVKAALKELTDAPAPRGPKGRTRRSSS